MIKVACNYGKQENNTCIVCGEQDTTEHIFLYEGNQSDTLTPEVYQQLIQKGGPSTEKTKLKQIACDIQQVIEDRRKLQDAARSHFKNWMGAVTLKDDGTTGQ